MTSADSPVGDAWRGTGPPPPTWGSGDPVVTSEGVAPTDGPAGGPTPWPTPAGAAGPVSVAPAAGVGAGPAGPGRRSVTWIAAVVVAVLVAAGVAFLVHRVRNDDRRAAAAPPTTGAPAGTSTSSPASGSAAGTPTFAPFQSTDPAFTMWVPNAVERTLNGQNVRFSSQAGALVRWTLEVRPAASGLDLSAALAAVIGRRGGTTTSVPDTGTAGTHLDALVRGDGVGAAFIHLAEGTDHLFVLTVPRRSGGSQLAARAIFDQMARSLQAPGVG